MPVSPSHPTSLCLSLFLLAAPFFPMFFIFFSLPISCNLILLMVLSIWSPRSDECILAHPQRVMLSVRALKCITQHFSLPFFSPFFLGPQLPVLPPFPLAVSSLLPPPSACNQSPGNWRAARIQFASALLWLKNQEELFPVEGVKRGRAEGGRMTGRSRKEGEEV